MRNKGQKRKNELKRMQRQRLRSRQAAEAAVVNPQLDDGTKKELYYRVSEWVQHRCDTCTPQACLYWAVYTMKELHELGVKSALQAGTAYWPRVDRATFDRDPQNMNTHYGYQWSPGTPASQAAIAAGHLPEVHLWVGLVPTQEIIDLSTFYWPEACRRTTGLDWPGPKPPQYLWTKATEVPDLVHYVCVREATLYVARLIERMAKTGALSWQVGPAVDTLEREMGRCSKLLFDSLRSQ